MRYLICQEWCSTKGNHAGMKHMCDLICNQDSDFTTIIVKEKQLSHQYKNRFINKINILLNFYIPIYFNLVLLSFRLLIRVNKHDEIFLLEYLHKTTKQNFIAKILKTIKPSLKISSLQHLTPSALNKIYSNEKIRKDLSYIDRVYTLGSSLSYYLISVGIDPTKIITIPHYVDDTYYHNDIDFSDDFNVICMGNLQRNFELLYHIVKSTPSINYTILSGGNKRIKALFGKSENVKLLPYLSEDELRSEMSNATVSLNVMEDTVGSNVITTSMAMGLAMIVSDVGSIRDYCSDENAFFCRTENDFKKALLNLANDRHKLYQMRLASVQRATKFHIGSIIQTFKSPYKNDE